MSDRRKLFENSFAMLVNRLAQGIGTFVITAAIARNLGAQELGKYLLAASYYYIFVNIASQGLKTLFTRELSRNLQRMPIYLGNGTLLQLLLGIIAYVMLVAVVWMLPYGVDTSIVCCIMGVTIIPFSLSNITEAVFQAQERMHLIAVSTVPVYILRLIAILWILQLHYGLNYIAGIIIFSETLIFGIEWLLLTQKVKPKWRIDQDFVWNTIKAVRTFFAIEAAGIVAGKMEILILSLLGSELLVGIYGGITQLTQPFLIIASSVALAAFPRMAKAVEQGREQQRQITENIIELLLSIALPLWVGLSFFGSDLLTFIYHDSSFNGVIEVLILASFTIILFPFSRVLSYVLISNSFERFNLVEVVITTVLGGVWGVILVSKYQLLGAASMSVIMGFSACGLLTYGVYKHLFLLRFWKVFSHPLLISSLMIPVFIALKKNSSNLGITLAVGTLTYIFFTGCMGIYAFGGPRAVLAKLSNRV